MSLKSTIIAGGTALTLFGAVSATGAIAASAATPPCGFSCIDVFSRVFGSHFQPNFVLEAKNQSQNVGTPIILGRASNADQGEDFTVAAQGTVASFHAAGLVTAAFNLHYHALQTWEFEYSPFGADSGLCVGVATTASYGTKVSLQPCGVSSKTLWVVDVFKKSLFGFYVPLINGSDTNFSHPFVLDYPSNGQPTDSPRPQLQTWALRGFSTGTTPDNQMWSANIGILP
jgi:hypothetical protein